MINKSMFKKLLISSLLAVFLLTSVFASYVKADTNPWYNQSFEEWSSKVFDDKNSQEIFGERYTYAQVTWIINSLAAIAIGSDILSCAGLANQGVTEGFKACINALKPPEAPGTEDTSIPSSPALGFSLTGDSFLATQPASGIQYVADFASRLHLIPEAKAQSVSLGFGTLQPIQIIWKAVRNLAYSLSIIAIIASAFMIMFRVKISPQTIITIQSVLPRLALTLLLITFSYAIAGFIIDLSYLIIGLLALFVKSGGIAGNLTPSLTTAEIFDRLISAHPVGSIFTTLVLFLALAISGAIAVAGLASLIPGVNLAVGAFAAGSGVLGVVFLLVIGVLFLVIAFRIWWLKLRTFINIVLLIIIGPLLILFGAISPTVGGFRTWLKNLIANVAVFPVIIIMAFLAHFFFWGFFSANDWVGEQLAESGWLNPYRISPTAVEQGRISLPGFRGDPSFVGFLAAFGILFLIPSVGNMIKAVIQGQPFAYGTAIGQAFGPITGAVGFAGGGIQKGIGQFTEKRLGSIWERAKTAAKLVPIRKGAEKTRGPGTGGPERGG